MKYSSWRPTRKWTMKDAMSIKLEDLLRMKTEEKADLASYFQKAYERRYTEAYEKNIMPFGIEKLEKDFETFGAKYSVGLWDRVTRGSTWHRLSDEWAQVPYLNNVLNSYISTMQDFFTWKSSSTAGWMRIRNKESGELFGWKMEMQPNGRRKKVPRYLMSDDERRTFWKLYHELIKREQNTLLQSDAVSPTHYKGIKDSMLADFWRDLALNEDGKYDIDLSDSSEGAITKLINIMEASMENKKLTFPEHIKEDEESNGNDPISGTAESENNDFWGRTF